MDLTAHWVGIAAIAARRLAVVEQDPRLCSRLQRRFPQCAPVSARGDEGNTLATIPSGTVFNLRGEFRVNSFTNLFFNLDSVFDNDYETFGVLGDSRDVLGDDFDDNRFLSPAVLRAVWSGIRIGTF